MAKQRRVAQARLQELSLAPGDKTPNWGSLTSAQRRQIERDHIRYGESLYGDFGLSLRIFFGTCQLNHLNERIGWNPWNRLAKPFNIYEVLDWKNPKEQTQEGQSRMKL